MESSRREAMKKTRVEQGSSEMKGQQSEVVIMHSRWKEFPTELHEIVLQFISIPELCRFRSVSRGWNDLTKQLSFVSKPRPQEAKYILRSMDTIELDPKTAVSTVRNLEWRWKIYDPSTHKSFKLSMELLYEGAYDRFGVHYDCITLAADKGFICVMWNSHPKKRIHVLNPITHSVVEIPPFSLNNGFNSPEFEFVWVVSMVVAEDYSAFSLYILMESNREEPERDCGFRFHSTVGEWKNFPQPPGVVFPEYILEIDLNLFTLFHMGDGPPLLLAFDTTRGTWSNTGVSIPHNFSGVQLVTALGRLFFVGFGVVDGLMVVEINVASFKCTSIASLDLTNDFKGFFLKEIYANLVEWEIQIVGYKNFLVFSSKNNNGSVAYDLVSSKWCEWMETFANGNDYGIYATTMNLTLNPVPAILHQTSSSNI